MSKQYSESLRIGILLALAGGFLDAYTYLCRGKVFANAQTGNMVMLGISFLEGNTTNVIKYIIPIIAFAIGVLLAEIIRHRLLEHEKIHWRQAVLAIEIVLLIFVAFIPYDYIANTLISLICAMQVESFRKFHGNAYATTMCTGNLRSGTEKLVIFIKNKDRKHLKIALQYYFIIFIFCFGAFIGGIFSRNIGRKAILISCIPLVLSLVIMSYKRE
ncbi:YoaK family protein [uncultured Clostridium sp.]|uniref:YoaK family protein n=1 Tax=uncultured Clostridium sp. TaxID=59620 RepID=UPI0025F4E5EA|nr:YoaK family protein [uncultured Clostridium sp.]